MLKMLKIAGLWAAETLFFYMLFAFTLDMLNPSHWSQENRYWLSFASVFSLICANFVVRYCK